jgi:hypothetical protein
MSIINNRILHSIRNTTKLNKRVTNFTSFVSNKLNSRKISRSTSKSRSNIRRQYEDWQRTKDNNSCIYKGNPKDRHYEKNTKYIQSNIIISLTFINVDYTLFFKN